jgi:hypothetical protein
MDEPGTSPPHQRAKSHISDNLRTVRRMACLAFAFWLAARSLSELLDGWSPQHFLAKRVITIVTYFRSQVVKFVFGGRNSGQRRNEEGTNELPLSNANEWQRQPEAKVKFNLWTWDHGL